MADSGDHALHLEQFAKAEAALALCCEFLLDVLALVDRIDPIRAGRSLNVSDED